MTAARPKIDLTRRTSFNNEAERYDRARPGYPDDLFGQIDALVGLAPGKKALEIGIGTGQATRHFLDRGIGVTGVDIGPEMLAVAARNFACRSCTLIHSAFEDFETAPGSFDLIYAAQSFHWVDSKTGYEKAARLLTESGALILIWSAKKHAPENETALDMIYSENTPSIRAKSEDRASSPFNTIIEAQEMLAAQRDLFPHVREVSSRWEQSYTAAEYIDLINTYSDHITLPDTEKSALSAAVSAWIESLGGTLSVPYETVAIVARKQAPAPAEE